MTIDPHELHMAVGEAAMAANDAFDSDAINVMVETKDAIGKFAALMQDRDIPSAQIVGMVVGMAVTCVYDVRGEGHG